VDNLVFRKLSYAVGGSLIKHVSLKEVKAVVWNCGSFKNPGPDGVNFGFVKEFLQELKDDVLRFLTEFHRNGRLTRGLNNSFIMKLESVVLPQNSGLSILFYFC